MAPSFNFEKQGKEDTLLNITNVLLVQDAKVFVDILFIAEEQSDQTGNGM